MFDKVHIKELREKLENMKKKLFGFSVSYVVGCSKFQSARVYTKTIEASFGMKPERLC